MLAITHATVAPAISADPVFAAIETHREALQVYEAEVYYQKRKRKGRWVSKENFREAADIYDTITSRLALSPIETLAGLRALTAYLASLNAYGQVAGNACLYAIEVWHLSDAMATIAEAMARLLPADAPTSTH
ncbi:hypothetical protein MKK70_22660 [Methylobacterium sp. E-041]|uniref:hypothetical protein n=1 Tax=Methylobacterium sp. E-041 TaxID=2836573 RepID=UPI001FBA455F|nr:hypothetical protein [Methylobacterium sp. E-041]MCJ2108124.1 hypothetical protein [Methylobacterium sp. E-041]